jgi:protein-tyrosine phosphatase
MLKIIKSLAIRLEIEIARFLDQRKRLATGLPTVATSQITPNLFVGGQYKLEVFENLKKLGITAIVNMRVSSIHKDKNKLGLKYLHLPTRDLSPPSMQNLKKGVKFIKKEIEKGGKVYIHCKAGEGRGPSMAIAYLISTGLTYADAYTTLKKVRRFIRPNRFQKERLREFENYINQQSRHP